MTEIITTMFSVLGYIIGNRSTSSGMFFHGVLGTIFWVWVLCLRETRVLGYTPLSAYAWSSKSVRYLYRILFNIS